MKKPQPFPFKAAFTLATELVREQFVPILVLFAIGAFFAISLEDAMNALTRNEENNRWVLQLALGLGDLVEGILLFLILAWGIPKVRPLTEAHFQKAPFQGGYVADFFGEYLRMLASSLLWGLLLVIPGFLRYFRLLFTPYVALFARPYREGKVDALRLAAELTKGRYFKIVLLYILTNATQAGVEFIPQFLPDLHVLPVRVITKIGGELIAVWLFSMLYLVFEQAMEEFEWT